MFCQIALSLVNFFLSHPMIIPLFLIINDKRNSNSNRDVQDKRDILSCLSCLALLKAAQYLFVFIRG